MSVESAAEEQFGPYSVYERLGVGGMATVHRALEHGADGFERMVALKRLLPHLAEDASFIKSFVREAKLASLLNHVNIVQIYELGRVGTEYFISMEYIDGRDIRRLLRHARKVTGPPPMHVTVGLMLQLCDALDYAHTKVDEDGHPLGLVHRDISPSNLIVTSAGHLKIIDFGIAKAQSSQLRTQTGRVKGKLAYMAPEAISGSRDLDARSDIWAVGVIIHELCTARPLFASKNEYQTLLKVQRGDIIPPSTFNQACPAELDAIVFRALARAPDDRFASAAEMRDQLNAVKRKYALQTSVRDISGWIEWAFGLESPGGFSGDTSGVVQVPSRVHSKTPRPDRDPDEDEAVEVVWGSGNVESEDGPVVLAEVPDVSDKHRARRDTDGNYAADDIPTPLPSHGTLPSIYGDPPIEVVPQPRGTDAHAPPAARGGEPLPARTRPSGLQPVSKPATGGQPAAKLVTGGQPLARPSKTMPPVTKPVPAPASSERRSDRQRAQEAPDRPATSPHHVDAPLIDERMAAFRDIDETTYDQRSRPNDRAATVADPNLYYSEPEPAPEPEPPLPPSKPLTEEELFGDDAAGVLAGMSAKASALTVTPAALAAKSELDAGATRKAFPRFGDEPPTLARRPPNNDFAEEAVTNPEARRMSPAPTVPVVRFSKSQSVAPPMGSRASGLDPLRNVVPQTKPGVGPSTLSRMPSRPPGAQVPLLQPPKRPSVQQAAPEPPPVVRKSKLWVFLVVGLVLAAAGAVTIVFVFGKKSSTQAPPATPTKTPDTPGAPAPVAVGTLRFVLEPADAAIRIDGTDVHAGSPWSTELSAGIHRIEIHSDGYKSWVTSVELSENETSSLRVVLEPVGEIAGDATLTISTTPEGLEVYIDDQLFAERTPIKTTLAVGQHKISVRQDGAEVWQQNVNAEAASDYEFNPSFTDGKKRERERRRPAKSDDADAEPANKAVDAPAGSAKPPMQSLPP